MTGLPRIDMEQPYRTVYDWLAANDVREWLPDHPMFFLRGDRLRYTAWSYDDDARGFHHDYLTGPDGQGIVEMRNVPLRVPPTTRVCLAIARSGAALIDEGATI